MHTKASTILKKFGEANVSDNRWLHFLQKNPGYIISSEWADPFRNDHPELYELDVTKESTYDGCVSAELALNEDGTFKLTVLVYNGNNMTGYRTDRRCTFVATLKEMPTFSADLFRHLVRRYAEREIEKQEKAAYEAKIATEITLLLMED